MLPTSLLRELYGQQISQDDYERLLTVPNGGDDPYHRRARVSGQPITLQFSETHAKLRVNTLESKEATNIARTKPTVRSISPMSSASLSPASSYSSPTEEISYWQDLEVYKLTDGTRNSTADKNGNVRARFCSFCYHNNEHPSVYRGHDLRDKVKNVVCPSLFNIVCQNCGATGTEAHTTKHCPMKKGRQVYYHRR